MFNLMKNEETNKFGEKIEELETSYKKIKTELSGLVGDAVKDYDLMSSIGGADEASTHIFTHYMNIMGISSEVADKWFESMKEEAKLLESINGKLDNLDHKMDELSKKLDYVNSKKEK